MADDANQLTDKSKSNKILDKAFDLLEQGQFEEAASLLQALAAQGDVDAQYNLGVMNGLGHGMEQNMTEAAYWYCKAAEQGFALAQVILGQFYRDGCGVDRDMSKAIYWLQKSAEQENTGAQFTLGQLYRAGNGTEQDMVKAAYWIHKAAMQGLAPAQYDFGIMNELGDGIKQDKSKAAYWYRKAAEQGDERAKEILEELNRPTSVTDEDDEFFDIFNELMDTDDQSLVTLVEKKENSEHGPFVNINNDLASFIEINEDCSDLIKMAYGYARRYAAAGMYAQGIIDNSSYNHVYSMFQGLQLKTRDGDGDSKEFQIKAARQAIEYMISYSKELDVQIIQFTLHIVENGLDSPLSRGETYDFNQVIAVLKELKSRLYPIS